MSDSQTVVVTGASRGIGRATAVELALAGWDVVAVYRSDTSAANELLAQIRDSGGTATAYQADVRSEEEVRGLFRHLRSQKQSVGAVVSNAGITRDSLTPMMSLRSWGDVIETNLTSSFLVARETLKAMRHSGGSLVFMSSISGLRGQPGQANYSASKGGVNALTKVLAREAASSGIRVNAIAPGVTDTSMVQRMPRRDREKLLLDIPLGRMADPMEIAKVARFLVGPESSYITGQVICVDGGLNA